MEPIDRRQLLTAAAGAAITTVIPCSALAIPSTVNIDHDLAIARELLSELELHHTSWTLYESVAENFSSWRIMWQQSYVNVVERADELRQSIAIDTPEARSILAKAAAIMPPPCERAQTYWKPIPNLSRKFRKASKRYYDLRADRIRQGGIDPIDRAWTTMQNDILYLEAKTRGDFELQYRVLQTYESAHDFLDIAHLRATRPDWKVRLPEAFPRRCGALPCKRCEEWFS